MYVLQLFNEYRSRFNGEEQVVSQISRLLSDAGHRVENWIQSSQDLEGSRWAQAKAFAGMTWSFGAAREMRARLEQDRPDVVHAHNLYPLFSPSVLAECRRADLPVVVSLHNQQLTCPKSDHLRNGSICEKCFGGKTWNCVTHNCRDNILESVGYAVRSGLSHASGWVRDNATLILGMTEFSRERLIRAGYPAAKIRVLPNSVSIPDAATDPRDGRYIAFAGRLSEEKGLRVLVEAARQCPDVPIHVAGDGPLRSELEATAPDNVTFRGRVSRDEMEAFYRNARSLVLPSTCFEMCPLTILEAMAVGLPVIASRTGGLAELVDHESTGRLVERGDAASLADAMAALWGDASLAQRFGQAGRIKAEAEFEEPIYLQRLLTYYDEASAVVRQNQTADSGVQRPVAATT